jgi:REP element-mobilizing transposase RayT
MRPTIPWPHAPTHQLSNRGAYFVTAGTYLKAHYFFTPQRLDVLHRGLLSVTRDFSWDLEAWAVFSNHYHFVAHSPRNSEDANSLSQMLGLLHARTAGWINRLDGEPKRKASEITSRPRSHSGYSKAPEHRRTPKRHARIEPFSAVARAVPTLLATTIRRSERRSTPRL